MVIIYLITERADNTQKRTTIYMNKILYIITLVAISLSLNAQNCDYLKNEIDEFSGKKTVITNFVNINKKFTSKHFFAHSFSFIEGLYFINFKLTGGGQSLFISKGNKLLLKLNDDSILELGAAENQKTEFKSINGASYSYIIPLYNVSREQLEKIADVGIKLIRMETSESQYDSSVTDKDNKKIKQSISCLLKE